MTPYRWREISIVFQGAMNALNPVQRMIDQIVEPMLVHKHLDKRSARLRARDLLDFVGIPARRASAYPHELSGGMRQRALIAMALSCDPKIIIGDEPTTALDVMVQVQILQLFERLRVNLGMSLLLVTHDLSVISETCERVLIMYAGRVTEEGPTRTVLANPRHPYTVGLLSASPSIRAGRRTLHVIPGSPPNLRDRSQGCRFAPRCAEAMQICTELVPPDVITDDGVRVACHLHTAAGREVSGVASGAPLAPVGGRRE